MKQTTVEIGKLLTDKLIEIFGEKLRETKGSGNQKGDLDLHYTLGEDIMKLWFEAKNKGASANAIIDRKEMEKAVKQANDFGATPVYATNDKEGNLYCAMRAEDFKILLEVCEAALEDCIE
jgi:hypothetical protein